MTDEARAILDENILGTLATVNSDGSAWATPLHVIYDETALYWFSNADKQHSLNIGNDPRVSLAIFSQDESRGPKGVYFNGSVEALADEDIESVRQRMRDRTGVFPSAFENATAYRLQIGKLNSSKSAGNCWYFYS